MTTVPFGYRTIFEESWVEPNIFARWEKQFLPINTGEAAVTIDNRSPDGVNVLRIGDNTDNDMLTLISRTSIPLDPTLLYRIRVSYKNVVGSGKNFIGLIGRDILDTEYVNKDGINAIHNAFYLNAENVSDTNWVVKEAYFRASDVPNGFDPLTGLIDDPQNPYVLHQNVKFIRPMLIVNHEQASGITLIGKFTIELVNMANAMENSMLHLFQNLKKTIDNDSFVYIFKTHAIAMSRVFMYRPFSVDNGDPRCLYTESIVKQMTLDKCLAIYYKNNNGKWVNFSRIMTTYPGNTSWYQIAEQAQELFKVSKHLIPGVNYTDADGFVHYIDVNDGDLRYNRRHVVCIDETNRDIVKISQYSIDDPNLHFNYRHLMQDLKIELTGYKAKDVLVWLNGVFVPIVYNPAKDNEFYIPNAMTILPTVVKDFKPGTPKIYRTNDQGGIVNATVVEDEDKYIHRYDIKIRLFAWADTEVSEWFRPRDVVYHQINYGQMVNETPASSIHVVRELFFNEPINLDAHFIMCNGMVLTDQEYYVDPKNNKHVILTAAEYRDWNLLREAIEKNVANPIEAIRPLVTDRAYSLVNFKSTDVTRTLLMRPFKSCAVDFPYRNEVTFADLSIGDLVLVDGLFVPYEYVHKHTIRYPKMRYSYEHESHRLRRENFMRVSFIDKE